MEKRKRGQPEVHPQEFFNPMTPRVERSARPVAQVAQAQPPSRTGQMISEMVPQMSQRASSLLNFVSDARERKGIMSALAGEERPEKASDAFIRGYERYNAMAKVNQYSRAVHDLYMTSGDMTPEEFIQARGEVEAEFLLGAPEEFIRHFVPKADEIATRYDKRVIEDQQKHLVHGHIEDTRQRMEAEYDLVIGMLEEDPDLNVGKELRKRLTQIQNDSKELKLVDRNTISQHALHVVGRKAVMDADPDIIEDFISEPDESGFALRHNPDFGDTALNYYQNALTAKDAQERLQAQEEVKAHKQMVEAFEKILIENLEEGTPEALQRARQLIDDWGPDISPATYHRYLKRLYEQQDEAYFARSSAPEMYDFFHSLAIRGQFAPELRDMAHNVLSRDDYLELTKLSNNALMSKQKAGPSASKWFNDAKASAMNVAMASGADDVLGRFSDTPGAVERGFLIDNLMNQWFANRIKEGTYGTVTWEEVNEVAEKAVDKAVKLYPIDTIYRGVRGAEDQLYGGSEERTPENLLQDERDELRRELEMELRGE